MAISEEITFYIHKATLVGADALKNGLRGHPP